MVVPRRLFMRRLDEPTVTELAGTQGAVNPFFSPDGQWLAFWDARQGSPKCRSTAVPRFHLADLVVMTGGSWADDGNLVVGTGLPGTAGLVRIAPGGGAPSPLVQLARARCFTTFPQVLPDRNAVLVATVSTPPSVETTNIDVVSLADGRRTTLVRGRRQPQLSGRAVHVVYANRAARNVRRSASTHRHDADARCQRGADSSATRLFDPVTGGAQLDVSREWHLRLPEKPSAVRPRRRCSCGGSTPRASRSRFSTSRVCTARTTPRLSPDGLQRGDHDA